MARTIPDSQRLIMVLNDGETFTDLENCRIIAVPYDCDGDNIKEYTRGNTYEVATFACTGAYWSFVTCSPVQSVETGGESA